MTWRQSNNQWSGGIAAHPTPKNFRVQKSAGKFLASIFWDQDDILFIDYLPKGQTINAEYYLSLLVQMKEILKKKCHGYFTKLGLVLHDNSPAHGSIATQKKLAYVGFQYLDYPPYSLDLAPSDSHLFSGTEKTIENSIFYFPCGSHCCRRYLVGGKMFEFFFEWLAKNRAKA